LPAALRLAVQLGRVGIRGLAVAFRLASAGEPVRIGIPIPPAVAEKTHLRLDAAGLSLTVLPLRKSRRSTAADQSDPLSGGIVDDGTDLLFGAGWYPVESSAGETLRWAQQTAEWIVFMPEGKARRLQAEIEPGPALGYGPFRLKVTNSRGETVAEAPIDRRTKARFSLPWTPGRSQIFTLHAEGSSAPAEALADPRSLNYRVMRIGWEPPGAAPASPAPGPAWRFDPDLESDVIPFYEGIQLGAGWGRPVRGQDGRLYRAAAGGAEIVLLARWDRELLLEVEPDPECTADLDLEVRDGGGLLAERRVGGPAALVVKPPHPSGRSQVIQLHLKSDSRMPALRVFRCGWLRAAPTPQALPSGVLHTNACGDFTLMAREHWFDLRGYAEFDLFSMNIDSLLCYTAHLAGVREHMLEDPIRIYHIEHETGSGWTPEGHKRLFDRLAANGIAWLNSDRVSAWAAEMERLGSTMIFNRENWGLAGDVLPETVLPAGASRAGERHDD
jgi:hypothetical protein